MAANKSSQSGSDLEFVMTRVFDAPRALVFKAWTDPKHMARWWGPRDFTNPVCNMDVRPGGAFRIVMRSSNGDEFPFKGVYLEVVEPERLVYTNDCSEHPEGWHDAVDPDRLRRGSNRADPVTTVTFEEQHGKTTMTIRMHFESAEMRDAFLKIGMSEGWSQSLERLKEVLAKH